MAYRVKDSTNLCSSHPHVGAPVVQIDEEQGEGLDHQEVSNAEVDKQHVAAGSQNSESSHGNKRI